MDGDELVELLIEHPERTDKLEEDYWKKLDGDQWVDLRVSFQWFHRTHGSRLGMVLRPAFSKDGSTLVISVAQEFFVLG